MVFVIENVMPIHSKKNLNNDLITQHLCRGLVYDVKFSEKIHHNKEKNYPTI